MIFPIILGVVIVIAILFWIILGFELFFEVVIWLFLRLIAVAVVIGIGVFGYFMGAALFEGASGFVQAFLGGICATIAAILAALFVVSVWHDLM